VTIWVDGALRDPDDATVSVLDHGLTVGDGVFETLKVQDGQPFAMTRHLRRLARSARGLGLPEPDPQEVARACEAVIAASPMPAAKLRVTWTGGPSPLGSDRGNGPASLVVAIAPAVIGPGPTAVATVPWTRNERGALAGLKTTSYGENVVALARAREQGATEALFANTQGRLCEGTGSNVFVVVGGRLLTPPLSSGCLAGITRELVLEWVGGEEADLPLGVLAEAEEIFLTSSTRDIQAVRRVDDRDLAPAPGPVTAKARRVFAERAAADPNP
jgi:branched-chain amino acid aminotransferase